MTSDPEVRYTSGNSPMAIAKYTLAVKRKFSKDGQPDADFIRVVAFGKQGEFAEKYLTKGMKIGVIGRIQTGSYTDREGRTVHTTDVVAEEHYFMDSKAESGAQSVTDYSTVSSAPNDNVKAEFTDAAQIELPF